MANHGKSYDDYEMTFFNGMAGMGETIANRSFAFRHVPHNQQGSRYILASQADADRSSLGYNRIIQLRRSRKNTSYLMMLE